MIIPDGIITIPTIPAMGMEAAVLAGVSAWASVWDLAWECPLDGDIRPMDMVVTIPIMAMEATMIPTGAMEAGDTVATHITEVPTGADITTDITMVTGTVIMVAAVITPKPITATGEWITGIMLVIQDLQGLPWEVQRELLRPIPGTGAAQAVLLLRQLQSEATAGPQHSVPVEMLKPPGPFLPTGKKLTGP